MKKPKLKDAIEYVNRVAQGAMSVAICWKFEDHVSYRRNRSFDGEHFIECLKVVVAKKESRVKRSGTEPGPTTPKPNKKPAGQKSVKQLITYNSRIVGPLLD